MHLENIVSSIWLLPGTLVNTANIIGILSVANAGQGPVFILTGFDLIAGDIRIELLLIPIFTCNFWGYNPSWGTILE